jgi:putative transposase
MSRPLRLEFGGALYHVTARGDRREPIVEDDVDRHAWLSILVDGMERFDAEAFAYCLMDNHYHVVVKKHQPNLSRFMRHLNGVYSQAYNRRHRKVGHLFQGRFKAILVDEDAYFLEVCRYVDLNPVRAGMVKRPDDWRFSSYRAHIGRAGSAPWLNSLELHRRLAPHAPRRDGPRCYAKFVAQGRGIRLWDEALTGQIFLGTEAFAKRFQAFAEKEDREIPKVQRKLPARPLDWYFTHHDRDTGIVRAYREAGYTQSAIAEATGLSVSRVSRLIKSAMAKGKT